MAADSISSELVVRSRSSSSFIQQHPQKCDVFINFRGEDTRFDFVSHLYNSLIQNRIGTFLDDGMDQLSRESISATLRQAIDGSRISIIVFSENYASSPWCLDALVHILGFRKLSKNQHIVLPIFYKVEPSMFRKQTGVVGEQFVNLEHRFKDNMERVLRWRIALKEAANLSGWTFMDGSQAKLIREIIEWISIRLLNRSYLEVAKYPIQTESRVQEMDVLLSLGLDEVRMINIWGDAGIGKTTVAKAVYNSIASRFEGSCFLENVGEISKVPGGLAKLQKALLSDILGEKQKVRTADEGIGRIKNRLRHKKILLILDNVNELNQLKNLSGDSSWFGLGSRVLVTTRDKNFLNRHQEVELSYEVKGLDFEDAVELFSWHAFKRSSPVAGYRKLAISIVGYAQGNPLALTAIGSFLYGRSKLEWQVMLDNYARAPSHEVHEILKLTKNAQENSIEVGEMQEEEDGEEEKDEEEGEEPKEVGSLEEEEPAEEKRQEEERRRKQEEERKEAKRQVEIKRQVANVIQTGGTGITNDEVSKGTEVIQPDAIRQVATSFSEVFSEWIFLIISLFLEVFSAICDQFFSPRKPHYALIGTILSILALICCICELIHKGRKGKVKFGRCSRLLWWFYCPRSGTLFGSFPDICGFISTISQCCSSIVRCVCVLRNIENPFKVNLLPIIFLVCSFVSKLIGNLRYCDATNDDDDDDESIQMTSIATEP